MQPVVPMEVAARLAVATTVDTGKGGTGPYREALVAHIRDVQDDKQGILAGKRVKVVSWFKHDSKLLPSSGWRVGQTATLKLVPFDSRKNLTPVYLADDHVNVVDLWYDTSVGLVPASGVKPATAGGPLTVEAALRAAQMKDLIPHYAAAKGRMWLLATGDSRVAQSFGRMDALVRDYTLDKAACQNLGVPSSPMPVQELAIRCAVVENPRLEWVVWAFGARFVSQKGHETALPGPPWPLIPPAAEAPTPSRSEPKELCPVGTNNWSLNQPAWDFFEDTVRELNRRNIGVLCVLATWKIYVEGTKLDHSTPYAALPVYQERMRNMEKRYPYFVFVCSEILLTTGEFPPVVPSAIHVVPPAPVNPRTGHGQFVAERRKMTVPAIAVNA